MIPVITAEQAKAADALAISEGTPMEQLMLRAAKALHQALLPHIHRRIAILCGNGNNGGDGFALAYLLKQRDATPCQVTVYAQSGEKSPAAQYYLQRLEEVGCPVLPLPTSWQNYDVIVDCLFGTGLNRPLDAQTQACIQSVNQSAAYILACDIPSGLHADLGRAQPVCIQAHCTVTFCGIKIGMLSTAGRNACGEIRCCDIGITPPAAFAHVVEGEDVLLPRRPVESHKGTFGTVSIIGGCRLMPGAPFMAADAAEKSGAGKVRLVLPECLESAALSKAFSHIYAFLPDIEGFILSDSHLREVLTQSDAVAAGMGMGNAESVTQAVQDIICKADCPLILDADALNCLASLPVLPKLHANILLTPHKKEFSRLSGFTMEEIQANPIACAQKFAAKHHCLLLLKGATTVITDGKRTVINISGTPALSRAGSGDILSGMVAALTPTLGLFSAAVAASFYLGEAGKRAANQASVYSVTARDIIQNIVIQCKA